MVDVIELNEEKWEAEVVKSDILTVVDYWHDHCPWCIRMNPIIDEVAKEYEGKIKFVKLNVLASQGNREIAIHYGVMSTPTLAFFCAGRPVEELVGFMPKERLIKSLESVLEKHRECIDQSSKL